MLTEGTFQAPLPELSAASLLMLPRWGHKWDFSCRTERCEEWCWRSMGGIICVYAVSSAENVDGFQLDPIVGMCAGLPCPVHCWVGGRRGNSSAGCSAGICSLVPFHSQGELRTLPADSIPMENSWTFICPHPRQGEQADCPQGAGMWEVDLIQHHSEALEKEQGAAGSPLWSQLSKELIPIWPPPTNISFSVSQEALSNSVLL